MIFDLPDSLNVNGIDHPIRTDFRDVLRVIVAMNDPNLDEKEKIYICLYVIYEDFDELKDTDYEAAFKAASNFIDCGENSKAKSSGIRTIDFEQDERLIISAVNRIAGCEVRSLDYLHWWTFMGYFMEIGECTYSTVLSIRGKKKKGKSLEKWEQEFFDNNKDICVIKEKLSDEELEELDRLNAFLNG